MRPGRRLAVAAGLVTLVLFVGNRTSRHPGLTTRRLSDDASDACKYCERLTRDWEKRVCGILSGGADGGSFFSDYFSGIAATATRKPRYECVNGRFVSFCVESNFKRPRHRRDIVHTGQLQKARRHAREPSARGVRNSGLRRRHGTTTAARSA